MVITEEDLRQAWQNGRGRAPGLSAGDPVHPGGPGLPEGVPAGRRAMAVLYPARAAGGAGGGGGGGAARPPPRTAGNSRPPPGQRQIYTAAEVPELLACGSATLVVHASVTITHAALELLRKAGVRVIPFVEQRVPLLEPFRPDPPLNPARMAAPPAAPRRTGPAPGRRGPAAPDQGGGPVPAGPAGGCRPAGRRGAQGARGPVTA